MQNTTAALPHACRINSPFTKRSLLLSERTPAERQIALRFLELRASLMLADEILVREIKRNADALLDAAQDRLDRIEAAKIAAEQYAANA